MLSCAKRRNPCSPAASGVRAWRWLMRALSSHLVLSFLVPGAYPGFVALPVSQKDGRCLVIYPRLPASNCPSVPGGLTYSHRFQPLHSWRRREMCGEGWCEAPQACWDQEGEREGVLDSVIAMTCGKLQVTAKLTGNKQQSPGHKVWERQWQWCVFDGLVS